MEALSDDPRPSHQPLTLETQAWRDFEQAYSALTTMDGQQRDTARQELREALRRIKGIVEGRSESNPPAGRFERVLD
jgi:hypothetical protein